jgi:hypothetical protein
MMSELEIVGDIRPLVEPGEYIALFLHHETALYRGKPKVYAHLQLIGPAYPGTKLFRSFGAAEIVGEGKRHGGYKLGKDHELLRQLAGLFPEERLDRLSLSRLKGKALRVSVRTVVNDHLKRTRSPNLQYSVIDEILGWVTGSLTQGIDDF